MTVTSAVLGVDLHTHTHIASSIIVRLLTFPVEQIVLSPRVRHPYVIFQMCHCPSLSIVNILFNLPSRFSFPCYHFHYVRIHKVTPVVSARMSEEWHFPFSTLCQTFLCSLSFKTMSFAIFLMPTIVVTSWTNNPSGAPSVAPSTGCSIVIIILFFRMNIVH